MAKRKLSTNNLAGPLRYAAATGNLKRVRELLDQGTNPNQRATGQPTPLIAAASAGHVSVIKQLLAAGADASFAHGGKRGTTALLEAIRHHHFDVAQKLIAAGADVHHDWSGGGQTITYEAANICNKLYRSGKEQDRRKSRTCLAIVSELLRARGKTRISSATQAAAVGNTALIRVFLKAGFDVNERDDGSTMFSCAVFNQHEDLAVELLQRGADPWADDTMFGAALHQAVVEGLTKIVRGIIAAKADLNRRDDIIIIGDIPPPTLIEDKDARGKVVGREWKFDSSPKARGATALIVAVRVGKLDMVRLLVEGGADLEATDADGFTALAWARKLNHSDIARILCRAGAKEPSHLEGSPLHALVNAATDGDLDRVKAALRQGADVNGTYFSGRERYTALMRAAEHGHVAVVDELFNAGANPDLSGVDSTFRAGITPLILAARAGHREIVERLLTAGARTEIQQVDMLSFVLGPKSQRGRPLDAAIHEAAAAGHAEIVKLLMKAGARPRSAESGTVLEAAAASGDKETLAALIGSDHKENRPTIQALIAAVESRNTETVRMLISEGADINGRTRQEHTPLASAAMNGDTEMVRLLLEAGARPVKASAKILLSELMYAASGGYADIVRLLLDAGGNADERARDGETALHWAATGGHVDAVKTLLDAGASPLVRNSEGKTPLQAARQIISAWTGKKKHPFAELTNISGYKGCVALLQAAEKASPVGNFR